MKREMTCIVCPMGCTLEVEYEGKDFISVKGNTCQRGADYAKTEIVSPVRTVTSTVRCENGEVLPVKTDKPIPKDKIDECMKLINSYTALLPVSVGDIIIKDVFGCNIVATKNIRG